MAALLSKHIVDKLKLDLTLSATDIETAIRQGVANGFLHIFYSSVGISELLHIATNGTEGYKMSIVPSTRPISEWKWHEILLDGNRVGEVAYLPSGDIIDPPPTLVEKLLVHAWNWKSDLVDSSDELLKDHVIFKWYTHKCPSPAQCEALQALFSAAQAAPVYPPEPAWRQYSRMLISGDSRIISTLNQTALDLVKLASQEQTLKWRFLSFYRILEHGYLESVLNSLIEGFYESPRNEVDKAKKSLENEVVQFVALSERYGLGGFFDEFADLVASLNLNRYIAALEKEWQREKWNDTATKSHKGIQLCYKVRCSIAHAGEGPHIVFEKFNDADEALLILMNTLERAVIHYLGIRLENESADGEES